MSQNATFLSLCSLTQIYDFKNDPNVIITSQIVSIPNFIALFYFTLNSRKCDLWLLLNVNTTSNIFDRVQVRKIKNNKKLFLTSLK